MTGRKDVDAQSGWQYPVWLLAALVALVLFAGLGAPHLWDRDEPRNARCAVEMLERGDWLVPMFNGELRAHKPILLYWLMLSAYEVFGATEFAARFWSAALGVGTALVTMLIGRRLFSRRAGWWAGLMLATSLNFALAARAATPDSALIFTTTLAMWWFVVALTERTGAGGSSAKGFASHSSDHQTSHSSDSPTLRLRARPHRGALAAAYVSLGLAVLAKGPVGVVLPMGITGLFLLLARSTATVEANASTSWAARLLRTFAPRRFLAATWALRPVLLVLVVAAVAAPWFVYVHGATAGAWTEEFFWKHNLQRATSAMEGHDGPIVFYVAAILAGGFPWSVWAAPVGLQWLRGLRRDDPARLGWLFVASWAGAYVVAFSLVSTKLPSYVLPAYPALALAVAGYWTRWLAGEASPSPRWAWAATGVLAAVGVAALVGLPLALDAVLPGDKVLALVGVIPLAGGAWCWWQLARQRRSLVAGGLAVCAVALCLAVFGVAQQRVDRNQVSPQLAAAIAAEHGQASGAPRVAAFQTLEPSAVYYLRQNVPIFERPADVRQFLDTAGAAYVVLDDDQLASLQPHLPADMALMASFPRFLKPGEVVLLGRPGIQTADRPRPEGVPRQ